jgi:uncharacterized protein (DUF58 family)
LKQGKRSAIEAANSLAYYFTSRGYRAGLYVLGAGWIVYPDTGRRQFRRISEELMRVEASDKIESFNQAIEACKSFLITYKPLIIFITRVEHSKPGSAVLKASRLSKRKLPVEVIALKKKGDYELATLTMEMLRKSILSRLRARARVVEWDIDCPLSEVLLREIKG